MQNIHEKAARAMQKTYEDEIESIRDSYAKYHAKDVSRLKKQILILQAQIETLTNCSNQERIIIFVHENQSATRLDADDLVLNIPIPKGKYVLTKILSITTKM